MSIQNLEPLLACRRALVIGEPQEPLQVSCLDQLQETARECRIVRSKREIADAPDSGITNGAIAVVFEPRLLDAKLIETLGGNGCRGVLWISNETIAPELLQASRPHRLRFIGPRTAGHFHASGLRAGAFPTEVHTGGLALITQSGSIATAAIDWAVGRGIGFSWAVTTGAEADADVADFLDLAALDPRTRAVILQVGRLRSARKFMSAARACARLKPVVVLQSRVGGYEDLSGPDPVRSAAFARAGLVECQTLDGLFDALTAMARLPTSSDARVLVLGNGAGMCALGVDAVLRHGLARARCDDGLRERMRKLVPRVRFPEGAVDLGTPTPEQLIAMLQLLLGDPAIDYLLLVQSPSLAEAHEPYVDALIEANLGPRVVTAWLGLASVVAVRKRSIAAGLATFVTAGQAARALQYRWLYGRTRELLMQTPPARERRRFRRADALYEIDAALADSGANSRVSMKSDAVDRVFDHYSLPPADADPGSLRFDFKIEQHAELGAHLTVSATSDLLHSPIGYGFAPLDALLATRMIESMKLPLSPELVTSLRRVLYALAQMVIDLPQVVSLHLMLALNEAGGLVRVGDGRIELDGKLPSDTRNRLVLAPYPEQLQRHAVVRNGNAYLLRPIRPEDEPALVALLESLRPEDIRMRFFASIRYFSHEMAARMTQIDYDRELILVALPAGNDATLCAVAHLVTDPYGEEGEFAVLVHHDHTGTGLGHRLMDELLAHARRQGLHRVNGDVLRENQPMLQLARRMGFRIDRSNQEPDTVRVVIDLPTA